jgi:predicted nucleotidyltransferase
MLSPNMPPDKMQVLRAAAQQLQGVNNVVAVVLGGSYALGTARCDSDIDMGIYYREASALPIEQIRSSARSICTPGTDPVVAEPYGW